MHCSTYRTPVLFVASSAVVCVEQANYNFTIINIVLKPQPVSLIDSWLGGDEGEKEDEGMDVICKPLIKRQKEHLLYLY